MIDRGGADGWLVIDARDGRIVRLMRADRMGDNGNGELTQQYGAVGPLPPVSNVRGGPRPPASIPRVASRTPSVPIPKAAPLRAGEPKSLAAKPAPEPAQPSEASAAISAGAAISAAAAIRGRAGQTGRDGINPAGCSPRACRSKACRDADPADPGNAEGAGAGVGVGRCRSVRRPRVDKDDDRQAAIPCGRRPPKSDRRSLWGAIPETGDLHPVPPWSHSCALPGIAPGQD